MVNFLKCFFDKSVQHIYVQYNFRTSINKLIDNLPHSEYSETTADVARRS